MVSIKQLEDQGRALIAQQKALVDDTRRPWSVKSPQFDRLQRDVDAVLEQHAALKAVNEPAVDVWEMGSAYTGASLVRSAKAYGGSALAGPPSLAVSEDDAQRLFHAAKSGQMLKVDTKAATASTNLGGAPVQYLPGFTGYLREPTRIAALMPNVAAASSTVDYYVLSGSTSAAAVAEGATKPESTVSATLRTLPMTKIATWARATSEVLADFPSFMSVLQADLAAGLVLQESAQILNGSGVAPNMLGILGTSGLLTQVTAASTDPLIALATAATALRNGSSYVDPTGIVMHPTDLSKIRTLKASGSGEFIAGDPFAAGPTTIWGIPVTTTTAIAAGTALMADFASLGTVFVRDGLSIMVDPYSQMTDNVTRVVAEERLAVAVVRPSAGIKITGLNS
jgi:HK97 family phage major capsid protein